MMSFKEFQALRTAKVAGPQNETKSRKLDTQKAPSPSTSTSSTTQEELHMKIHKLFPFIEFTYRDLHRFISGLHKNLISSQLILTINKYKSGCKEIYEKALESYDLSYKLAQNIVRTIDIFKELSTCLSDLEEYNYRMCEIMSIFIVCELRLSVDAAQNEQLLIAQRIIYIMRKHLVREEESETLYNILRTLVYIPKLFNARDIMCAIFGEFIPLKPVVEVNVLPDKLYMLYIIVFYRWMMMRKEEDDKLLVVNFAESFMKPSVSLCSNNLYGAYLPMYTTHSTATRTILNNLTYYRDVRNASIIDNALKPIGVVVNLCDDDEDDDVVVCSSPSSDFAQMFASVRLEPLSGSMSNIKLEEKTVVDTVDLTNEEEPINPVISLSERHDKWLNEFKKLAQQYRESQLLLQRKQTNQLISSGEKNAIISLDSDSEQEDEISPAERKETPVATTARNTKRCDSEELFVDNYPITNTPLHCDSELESLDADEDTNDVTKISSRFLSGVLRTYQAKKSNLVQTSDTNNSDADEQDKPHEIDKYLRRDSLHIYSTPPEETQNEDDDSTDVQDEHEDEEEEVQAYAYLPTTTKSAEKPTYSKQIRPMGPYPTYNSMHNDKVVFSQTTLRYRQQQQQYNDKQYYNSDSSATKSPKKQKKKVQFNTNPLGPTGSSASQTTPLKKTLQQIKYKVSDAPEYSHLRGFERFSCVGSNEDAASTLGSTSTTSSTKQQEPTNVKCIKQASLNIKNCNHNNKSSNLYKNLSVFKQKSSNIIIKQKSIKNVKINLKKLRLDKDISLTNFKSNFDCKERPHTTIIKSNKNNSNNDSNRTICTQTVSSQLRNDFITSATHNNDDDLIFKKPLPVTKKLIVKSSKPLKIQNVVSLRKYPYYIKRRDSFNSDSLKNPAPLNEYSSEEINILNGKEVPVIENKLNIGTTTAGDVTDITVYENQSSFKADDLSKISKLLTDEISSLTCKMTENNELKATNDYQFKIDSKDKKEKQTIIIQSDIVIKTSSHSQFCEEQAEANRNVLEKEELDKLSLPEMDKNNFQSYMHNLKNVDVIDQQHENSILLEGNPTNSDKENTTLSTSEEESTFEILQGSEIQNETLAEENKKTVLANEMKSENKIVDAALCGIPDLIQNKVSTSEEIITDDIQTVIVEQNNETIVNHTENGNNFMKPVTNFSAEFLAGLPNEPSSPPIDSVETECQDKNENDFEFENNCSTPTMCRLDLDVMSENTSDVPAGMSLAMLPIAECEADKLLEDFNNKTDDIVGSALNKKKAVSSANTFCTSSRDYSKDTATKNISQQLLSTSREILSYKEEENFNRLSLVPHSGKETLKRLREIDIIDSAEELISKSTKRAKCPSINNEQTGHTLKESKIGIASNNNEKVISKNFGSDYDHSIQSNVSNNLPEPKKSVLSTQSKSLDRNNYPASIENFEETTKSQSESSCEYIENKDNEDGSIEQSTIDEIAPHKMEGPINENQHMTVELDKIKTSDSDDGGVSAIFSFPKIPIISISIHTTPNNKTYFKISNRENDNSKKDAGNTKQFKSSTDSEVQTLSDEESITVSNRENDQSKDETNMKNFNPSRTDCEERTINEEKIQTNSKNENETNEDARTRKINSPSTHSDEETTNERGSKTSENLDLNEISNKEKPIKQPTEEYNEEDNEAFDKENLLDEEIDNFEIDKFSHDSNSACSLPLKKRPTQAEPNDDTEDSQAIMSSGSYEHLQEIAAEVVIENACKNKSLLEHNISHQLKQNVDESETQEQDLSEEHSLNLINELDDNKPSTSAACLKKLLDPSSLFKRRVHTPIRPAGQTPIQIVAPQLKDNVLPPSQDHRLTDAQLPSPPRIGTQNIQTLPESYPATPMLSVANVEKLMDFNRFTEYLLASPDVMTIIDNANACGYYAEGQTYEMERIAILEHYNIANAKGSTSATKPLYWKKSAGDTISIFNDNDNEWISLPPSTAKQLQKLSFVLSILQQQYKVTDVRQRINIALTFLIRNTSKYKNTPNSSSLQPRTPLYSRNISDLNSSNHTISQSLPSSSFYRVATNNNEVLNTNLNLNSNMETSQDFHATNYSSNQQQPEMTLQLEQTANSNQNWNSTMRFASSAIPQMTEQTTSVHSPQRFSCNSIECDQQQTEAPDRRNNCWDELNNDQLYINPPCATSPQNEVIVNTNGVELHEIPQDPQNIFISITDESVAVNGSPETSFHKYNTRQQQQQFRTLGDGELPSSSSSITQQSFAKRSCVGNNAGSLIPTHFMRNNIIPTFGNREINLQNPYRMQQKQIANQNMNSNTNSNITQRNITQTNSTANVYNNNNSHSSQQQNPQHRICTRFNSSFNTQVPTNSQQSLAKSKDSNYKEILQPYITYLIKDHEKTSKHLLQVFEEVSNSNTSNEPSDSNLQQQQFKSLLPPLIRNPQQNHMPGFHQFTAGSSGNVLPSLIRNPHDNSLVNRDSGALQLVQSFLEQSQTTYDSVQHEQRLLTDKHQQQQQLQQQTSSSYNFNPGFAKEYVNFVGCRDDLTQKHKLRNFNKNQQFQQQQLNKQFIQQQQDTDQLNSSKRKCQERNDKLAEDLKRKIMEFSLLKNNVQVKQLEKQQKQQGIEINEIKNYTITTKRRGRPKKVANSVQTAISEVDSSPSAKDHLEAAALFFRHSNPPSLSSVSSRSLTSPGTPSKGRKKFLTQPNKRPVGILRRPTMGTREDFSNSANNEECYSIIRNRDTLNDEYHSTGRLGESTYGGYSASDLDIIIKPLYKNDPKLRKRCVVVLTPNEQVLQHERKERDEMYNKILQNQRRRLELRALEKQREKERRQLGRCQEEKQTKLDNRGTVATATTRSYNEFCMRSESECETKFELRTRKPRQQHFKELAPLNINIEMSPVTTTLLSQIESHLDKPASENIPKLREKEQPNNSDINKQTCDANNEKSPRKMRELNLLADIAHHLSPYQLDLPENNNNRPRTSPPPPEKLPITTPTPTPPPPLAALETPNVKEVPKEKITITEQLIIKSLDNLLEKKKPQLDNNDQEQQALTSYAHEPKLNTAIFKSSPSANSVQTQNQQSTTQLEINDNNLRNNSVEKEITPKTKTDETLEQILEESISVLKSVTGPCNPPNDYTSIQQQIRNSSTTPILISNVESINEFEQTDVVTKQKSGDKENIQDTPNKNSKLFALAENEIFNKETYEKSKDFMEENRERNESTDVLSSNILNCSESSIMCAADVPNILNESEMSRNLKLSSLMSADLSEHSIESEISKHLPEIAEPSPVVTDMSDNSNESDVSKDFGLHVPIISNSTNLEHSINEINVPDLSLVMPNISQNTTPSTSQALENSFNQFNCSLNTPTKLGDNQTNDLNTPLKFAVQPNLESTNMPLKNSLEPEPETDNNVTKFLDLILNKTVTDAESETRDEIMKELNALTADTTEVAGTPENISNNETLEPKFNEEATTKSIVAEDKTLENNTLMIANANDINHGLNKSQEILELSSRRHIQNNSSAIEIVESICSQNEQNDLQTTSSNTELNPPKENHKEAHTQILSDISTIPFNPSSPSTEIKSLATKQSFNIRCRVRLKRLNIDEHCRINKNESCAAMPIIKPIELVSSNNDITKCDNDTTKILSIKKPCLKHNNKHANIDIQDKIIENLVDEITLGDGGTPFKKPKLEIDNSVKIETTQTLTSEQLSADTPLTQHSQTPALAPPPSICNNTLSTKSKAKLTKTVTFDLSNLNEDLRDSTASNQKQKSKSHAAGASGCYLKSSRSSRKLPDNTLRAAETLQLFVNTINESVRTPPATEFNKKRSPIKNKCIAEDETPRPPPASTLMGTPPCKKTCVEKSRSQISTTKCKDQLVSSLGTPSISSITSDIATARIYTSSPLDQTLPEYDDNVDTVADSELILPTTSGSLRRKLKRPKKSLSRPEPADDVSTDEISNQPECNGEDDTDAVVDNEDDVFAEELLPIPAANEHILEEIVSARPSHIGTGTVIRDDYMNIEATATVPVYLFNDESRELGSPEIIQSSDTTSVVDSSSYLKSSTSMGDTNNVVAAIPPSAPAVMGNLEKSMLSPSEHEVSSTQETFYQTPTKNKQKEIFSETSKEKGNGSSGSMTGGILKQKADDNNLKNKEEYQTSSNIGLLQNNQVDTTNHSPEMCSLSLTATTPITTNLTSNRKIRKASTHDEILFNELQQQQLPSNKRKSHTFCVESTSDNKNKTKIVQNNMDDVKSNGSLTKVDDKFKKLLKEVCKKDNTKTSNELDVGLTCASNIGGGGSSPSTTTTINEDKLSKSKRKKLKSSKSNKNKSHSERSSKIVLKASKLTPPMPANPLIITIPKSRLLKPPSPPKTQIESKDEEQKNIFLDILHSKLFIEKDTKDTIPTVPVQNINQHNNTLQFHSMEKNELSNIQNAVVSKSKNSHSFRNISNELVTPIEIVESDVVEDTRNTNSTSDPKEKSSLSALATKRKEKVKTSYSSNSSIPTGTQSDDKKIIFVKDKYDLIKSKDKHHHQTNQIDQQDTKEKSKDKTRSHSKSAAHNNARSHKSSFKEKVKGEKSKEKHKKDIQKIIVNQQADNNPKLNISQSNNKLLNSASSMPMISSFTTSNTKQSNSKSSKNNSSSSSSSSSLSYPAILKSKTNLTTTQSATATAPASDVSSPITTATPSTNNVRKKLKLK